MVSKKTGSGMKTAVGTGVGIVAVSALALGTYLLYGKDGAKNRKKAKAWMLKAKGEVLEEAENLKEMSLDAYQNLVQTVTEKYAKMKDVDPEDIEKLVKELKSYGKQLTTPKKKAVKKTVKKGKKK
jgi:uncharacterized protein YpuA (DUF1002 family)